MLGGSRLSRGAPRLRRGFTFALLAAAALHALFFAGIESSGRPPPAPAGRAAPALWVQELAPVAPAPAPTAVAAPEPPTHLPGMPSPARRARAPDTRQAQRLEPAPPPSAAAATPAPAGPSAAASNPSAAPADLAVMPKQPAAPVAQSGSSPTASTQAAAPAPEPAAASATADSVPVYATKVPAPVTLQYRMRRGILHGNAELTWRLDAVGGYEARLEARASGIALLTQVSQGGIDAAGLAPLRFTDKRVRRGTVAANIQRDPHNGAGRITFSGSEPELALHAGTQDRLSWMVQLAAIASAAPQLLAARGKIAMHVIGARGDAAVWQFQSSGEETLGVSPAALRAFRLQRLPQGPYDTQVDVWLDATPPHWPVRAHWRSGPQDPGMEMWRIDVAEPP